MDSQPGGPEKNYGALRVEMSSGKGKEGTAQNPQNPPSVPYSTPRRLQWASRSLEVLEGSRASRAHTHTHTHAHPPQSCAELLTTRAEREGTQSSLDLGRLRVKGGGRKDSEAVLMTEISRQLFLLQRLI